MDEPPSFNLGNIFTDEGLLYYILTVLLLFITAWASSLEAALFALHPDEIARFKNSVRDRERRISVLLSKPRLLLNALTALKYLALLVLAILTVATFWNELYSFPYVKTSVATTLLLLTIIFSIGGIIIPKIYGRRNYLNVTKNNSRTCIKLVNALSPVVAPLLRNSENVERKLDLSTEQKSAEVLTRALQLAIIDNEAVEGEKEILRGIVNFGSLTVNQVMRQRHEIFFTDIALDFHQLLEFVKRSGYSRIPVCKGSLDNVAGFLYIKDLLPYLNEAASFPWQKLLRPGNFSYDSKKLDFLLKEFQEKRVHLALVINSLGYTVGLITLEDIIEEIIGDINDEFDEVAVRYQQINERTYVFDAKTSLHEFCTVVGIDPELFQPVKGLNDSLNAALLEVNEKLPSIGDEITIEPFTFIVESVDRKRIKKIRVNVHEHEKK